ncbi:MAG: hypothetical protein ACUVQO_13230 [Leptodesmis sp.]
MNFSATNIKITRTHLINFLIIPSLIFIACYLVFLTSGLLSSGFRFFINDHIMVAMDQDLKESGFLPTVQKWLLLDRRFGRFQPFYYAQAVILTIFLGVSSTVWFSYAYVLTSLMVYFLFLFARFLEIPSLTALIFASLALIGPQAIAWAQPSQPQLVGTFLLSASLLFAGISAKVDRYKTVFNVILICLVFLMSLSKESYIIFIPALTFIKVWLYHRIQQVPFRSAFMQNRLVIFALFGIAFLEILYIIFGISIKGMGYAGLDENTLQISKILSATITLFQKGHLSLFVLSFVLALTVTLWKRQSLKELVGQLIPVFLIFLLIVVPQIILYTKSGFYGIYFIPATIGTSLLISYTIFLLSFRSKILSKFVLGIAIFIIYTEMVTMWGSYSQMAKDSKTINNLFQAIYACTPNNEPVLIVANPRVRFEAYIAMKATLNSVFQRDNLLIATYGLEKTDFFSDTLGDAEKTLLFLDPLDILEHFENKTILNFPDKSKIKAVVVFDDLDNDFLKTSSSWFVPENFHRNSFSTTIALARLYCKQ